MEKKRFGGWLTLLIMAAMILPMVNSCNKKPADISDLLKTVPSSANTVVGINVRSILEDLGCKIDGVEIKPGKEVNKWLESNNLPFGINSEELGFFLKGESGIDPVGAILFTDAYTTYLTAMVADTGKFKAYVEKQTGKTFSDPETNVSVCSNIALCGAQMWINLSSDSTIDAKAVKNYSSLETAQSFLSTVQGGKFAEMDKDIVGYGQIKKLLGKSMSFGDQATINMATAMLFDNASLLTFETEFDKGELRLQANVLNDKGEPAKYLLPTGKIDAGTVNKLEGPASMIMGIAVTKDLVKKIEKAASSLGGNMIGGMSDMLKNLDGTSAIAMSLEEDDAAYNAVITTDGDASQSLMSMLSAMGSTRKDGKYVLLSKGNVGGTLEVAKIADQIKGAAIALAFDPDYMSKTFAETTIGLNEGVMTLKPEKGSLVFNMTLRSKEKDTNILITLLNNPRTSK